MIYISDTPMHPGLFAAGEWDLHAREVDFFSIRKSLRNNDGGWLSAVRGDMTASFLCGLLGRDVRPSDEEVWLTPDDVLYVATFDNQADPKNCKWQAFTVAPYWQD